ncbi:MAG TPA: DUF3886 domain-containing protein [Bacilli bacterium]|nr:DUF3886 domain-containing protein [Bacilli bacterium]
MGRQHRHRDKKVKKMHSIIGGYAKVFDGIGEIEQVRSVITGVISLHKSESEELTFQYFTDSGLKLLAKTTDAIQEVFVVTDEKQRVLEELYGRGFLEERVKKVRKGSGKKKQAGQRQELNPFEVDRRERQQQSGKAPKDKPTTLKDMLSPEMLAKLQGASADLKEQEKVQQEKKRQAELDRREQVRKEQENDFEFLLKNSKMDWKDFK